MMVLSDLFTLEYGHSLELNRLTQSSAPGAINFVARTIRNNGVSARVAPIAGVEPAKAGTITVALNGQGGAGTAFLQPYPFYSGYHVMVLTPKEPMTVQEKLWWVTCITANRFRFGFGRQANKSLSKLAIPPRSAIPDWVKDNTSYQKMYARTSKIAQMPGFQGKPGISGIGPARVKLSALFDVIYGHNLELNSLTRCDNGVNFISRTAENNGVSAKVRRIEGLEPTEAGVLTVAGGGSVLETFFQPEPFYSGRDLYYLRPKVDMTLAQKLFYCVCIRENRFRYNYGRQANKTLRDLMIPDMSEIPDWVGDVYGEILDDWANPPTELDRASA